MENVMNTLNAFFITYGLQLIAAIVIFIVGRWLAGVLSALAERLMLKSNMDKTLAAFVKNSTYVLLLVVVIIAALNKLGMQTTSLVAVIGAAGLAVGLALQGSLANFAAGVLIILFKPFRAGDFVEVGGVMGSVNEIHIFNTILLSPDNKKIILPNAAVTGGSIVNFSVTGTRRVDLLFSISYDDDMKLAKQTLQQLVTSDERILNDPAPVIAVSELADSSVNLVCRPWVKTADYWPVYFDLLEKGKLALEQAGLSIPFPQRDVHLYQEK